MSRGLGLLVACIGISVLPGGPAYADCASPANAIEAENCLPGNPSTEWDVSGSGDSSIQGFATDISVNRGQTVQFKVRATTATNYRIDIYRLGYYGGDGARKVATVTPSATLPQSQPACLTNSTGLVDCGNWAVSASWAVPATATSGIYLARLVRPDTSGASHVVFIVRDDGGNSELLFQTADTTWQAYNRYGGNSLYQGSGPGGGAASAGRAYKVSYNRPFTTRDYAPEDWLFNAEYPMVRWLEQNGYDVSYFTGVDTDRRGAEIAEHGVFLSVGHDEYWSKQQRLNVEKARDQQFAGQAAPVHLAFFSGNEVFWKTRWESSIDSSGTAYRTLVCYKETHAGSSIDPSAEWTGTWRDPRPFNPEGPQPENALMGTLFTVNCCSYALQVPAADARMRFWRNTPNVSLLSGSQVWTGPADTIGYEWDEDLDNGVRPAGLVRLSATTVSGVQRILDYGSTYGPGTATHRLVFHKRPNGALVFGAGTIQWPWGLDREHDRGSDLPSPDMQQATVNLFADMGAQPATLDPELVPASASNDAVAPVSTITSPANNANVPVSVAVTIQGTATDTAPGQVGGVEVSVDGGLTWHPAVGRGTWSYVWTPTQNGTVTILARAVDDTGNLETPGAGRTVVVGSGAPPSGAVSIWAGGGSPDFTNVNDGQAIGLGVKFRTSVAGNITAIRFYKGDQDTGTHVGRLWSVTGTVLATATFSGETASGWQEVPLPSPVAITANTTYVASYHSSAGYYAVSDGYFTVPVVNGPLTALADGTDGPNGLYRYTTTAFPNQAYQQSNYWVDVVFSPPVSDATPSNVTGVSPPSGAAGVTVAANVTATFSEVLATSTVNGTNVLLRNAAAQLVAATVTWDAATRSAILDPTATLAFSTTYTATVRGGTGGVTDVAGNLLAADVTWTFTTQADPNPPDTTPPTVTATSPPGGGSGVVIGSNVTATFSEALAASTVNGTNVQLRNAAAQLVAATVTWDAATRSAILDPTASLAFSTSYTATVRGGAGGVTDVTGNPLAADVTWTFTTQADTPPLDTTPPTITAMAPSNGATGVAVGSNVTATFSETLASSTVNGTTVQLRDAAAQLVAATVTWDAATRLVTLDPTATLAFSTSYTATVRGGTGGVTDVAGNPLAADVNWTFTTQANPTPPDTTPPTVTATSPASGASGVVVGSNVTATFSEALATSTVNGTSVQLRDVAAQLVPATVTWNASTRVATLDPAATLAFSATYTATVRGGIGGGVTDVAGNPLAADATWTFTTQAAPPATVSIWAGSGSPDFPNTSDGQPLELGVKFRSSVAGQVLAIRFYKGNQDTGVHVGSLWSAAGTRLATATFSGETPSGWQEVALASPVAITANTTYVASYHSSAGDYALTEGYFTSAVVNGSLTALANGTDGGNGVYRYGSSAFPNQSFQQSNYWVDVVFSSAPAGPDTTPPTVIATTPTSGASGVLVATNATARFVEALASSTVHGNTFQLRDADGQLVPATVTWDAATLSAVLDPTPGLAYSTTYTATVTGGSGGVTDVAGNPLAGDVTWTFTTQAAPPPPPEEGPGGPILVIGHSANPFSRYYAEILRAEGMNAFKSLDISAVDATVLSTYDVAILGEMPLTPSQVAMLTDWVNAGGNLIAMRPDKQLAGLLGLTASANTLGEAYLQVSTGAAPGLGIVAETVQFHGTADRYTLGQATAVATLFSNATTATSNPAVTLRTVGLGKAAAFTFDLARSVVYTRQGNPAWAGDERDGVAPIRSDDLFYGAKAGNVQPDWVNLSKVAIPQADEQQRLLANLILHMNRDRKPLPRFWYFPFGKKAVVVMTSDNHGNGAQAETRLDRQLTQDPPACDLNRWECVRSSMYLYLAPFGGAASYQAQGFDIGVHITTNCGNYTPASLAATFTEQLADFQTLPQFAGVVPPVTNRTHCIAWSDWASQAKVSLQNGIRLDTNYYYWPGPWVANRPGHFTGSGMPMRFADLDGSFIDVYQAATQITDESSQTEPFTIDTLLNRALGAEGYYAAITANIHSDNGDDSLSDFIVDSAQARGVPVVSARQMLTWLDGRNGSSFEAINWSGDVLTFGIEVGAGANGLEAMLPTRGAGPRLLTTLTRGGIAVPYSTQTVKGVEYAVFAADPGTYQATYTIDVTPPVISSVSASVGTNGTATVQWLTDERATSVVQYGTAPASLGQTVSVPLFVTNHSLVITGLSASTTYYFRATSVDPSGNSAASAVSSFQVTVVDTVPPAVSVVRPNGAERVFAGTPYVLQWTATDAVGVTAVDVAFSSNGGSSYTAVAGCTGLAGPAQSCSWTAPGPTTTQGRIRVTARDGAGLSASDTSNANFSVVTGTASLTLTAPTTAVTWRIGNTQNVTFTHNFGVGQTVVVDVSRDGGATWTTVNPGFVTTSTSSGTVPWVVTGPVTGSARVRVAWSGNPAIASTSPVNFAIVDRISITAPNTAVSWPIGSARSITWNHNLGTSQSVNIDVSRDGGATWSAVATNVANSAATTGTFSWTVAGPSTTTSRVRVSWAANPAVTSVSAVNFTISP